MNLVARKFLLYWGTPEVNIILRNSPPQGPQKNNARTSTEGFFSDHSRCLSIANRIENIPNITGRLLKGDPM